MKSPRQTSALNFFTLVAMLAAGFSLSTRMTAQVPEGLLDEDPAVVSAPRIPDKIEGINRFFFKINDGFYRYALHPLARGYASVVPRPLRHGIGNVFHNLGYPTRLAGNILEGHPQGVLKETGRFVVNTLVGFGGFVAVANSVPALHVPESDLGQAFATWGVGHGTYLVLPLLGPSSARDGVGEILSGIFLSPVQYLKEWEYRTSASTLSFVNQTPDLMNSYDTLRNAAIDPYVALRDAFSSRRAQQVRDQKTAEHSSP